VLPTPAPCMSPREIPSRDEISTSSRLTDQMLSPEEAHVLSLDTRGVKRAMVRTSRMRDQTGKAVPDNICRQDAIGDLTEPGSSVARTAADPRTL